LNIYTTSQIYEITVGSTQFGTDDAWPHLSSWLI